MADIPDAAARGSLRLDDESRAFVGYFIAVASGAAAFWPIAIAIWLLSSSSDAIALWWESGTVSQLAVRLILYLLILAVWVFIAWIVALPPFLLVRWIARKLRISHLAYYLCAGAASGALMCGLHEAIGWASRGGAPGPDFVPDHLIVILGYGFGATFAAFVFWRFAVRPRHSAAIA